MKSRFIYLKNKIRRYRHAPLLGFAGRIMLFILGGIAIGMISAWVMLEKGSPLTQLFLDRGACGPTMAMWGEPTLILWPICHALAACPSPPAVPFILLRKRIVKAKKLLQIAIIRFPGNHWIQIGGPWLFTRKTALP